MSSKSVPKVDGTYPNLLEELEKRDGYRITEVARYLGLTYPTYYDLRRGRRQPSMDTMQKIERLFDVSIQDVFTKWGEVSLHFIKEV
jgi:DNA-binding XRE family transcriptional regulator